MKFAQAIKALADLGTAPNREVYRRHGAKGHLSGVGLASLDALAAEIGVDHGLARKLWKHGAAESRLLATRVADAESMQPVEINRWAKDLDWYVAADALAKLADDTPFADELALSWIASRHEWTARAGWHTLALLTRDKRLDDSFFEPFVHRIEQVIHRAPNRARDAMNAALIAIGIRSPELAKLALSAAKRIGKVHVVYRSPELKTADAATYIRRARQWIEEARAKRTRGGRLAKATHKPTPKKAATKKSPRPALPARAKRAAVSAASPPRRATAKAGGRGNVSPKAPASKPRTKRHKPR